MIPRANPGGKQNGDTFLVHGYPSWNLVSIEIAEEINRIMGQKNAQLEEFYVKLNYDNVYRIIMDELDKNNYLRRYDPETIRQYIIAFVRDTKKLRIHGKYVEPTALKEFFITYMKTKQFYVNLARNRIYWSRKRKRRLAVILAEKKRRK